ncbi:hypothetical protein GCM10022226_64290 [Sphaerisporangium flaviroseum]|uniref:Uncharacterized protein n=1 Tax=Sphaerisporangium flaviroseum TaxID=509199 RepID=A0ABP7J3S0_9ACTN
MYATLVVLLAALTGFGLSHGGPAEFHGRSPDITAADGPLLVKALPSTAQQRIVPPQTGSADLPSSAVSPAGGQVGGLLAGERLAPLHGRAAYEPSLPRAPPAIGL